MSRFGQIGYLMGMDTVDRTVAFIDAELHFRDGLVLQDSIPIVDTPSEFTQPRTTSSLAIGDVVRAGLFNRYEDLKDYRIVNTVFPSEGREFRRRIRERRKEIAGARLYRNALSALIYHSNQLGSQVDLEL